MNSECTISHPHELMDCCCEHKTKLAKQVNENVHLRLQVAELERKLAEQQAIVVQFFGRIGDNVPDAGKELSNLLAKAKEEEREACALLFEGQYTDSCPQTNISETIRRRT